MESLIKSTKVGTGGSAVGDWLPFAGSRIHCGGELGSYAAGCNRQALITTDIAEVKAEDGGSESSGKCS